MISAMAISKFLTPIQKFPHPTWKNWQTGEVLKDKYVQDTFAQYTANRKRYAVMAKER